MLDHIRELTVNGQWQEVLEQGAALLSSDHRLERDDVAWVHLTVAAAYASSTEHPGNWTSALQHAYSAYNCATPGGMRHTSALFRISSILVDTGRTTQGKWFAQAYLKAAPSHADLAPFAGWPLRNLGIAAMRAAEFSEAIKWYRRSIVAFTEAGNETQATRGRLHLVWAYCLDGQPALGRLIMPDAVPEELKHFFHSALAVLSAAEGHWSQALRHVEEALLFSRPGYDNVDAADLCLLASRAARRHGVKADVMTYECRAKAFAALQGVDAQAGLILSIEREGGVFFEATASLRGSSDLRDGGCFTTGFA